MTAKRILLTGAAGWIGSHLARQLARENEVVAWVRPGSDPWRLRPVLRSLRVVECDLRDASAVAAQVEAIRPEVCFHVAWYAVPGSYRHSLENLDALEASIRLAVRLHSLDCQRFIGVGSCFEYDTDLGRLSEHSPTKPRTMYAAAKLAFQLVLEQISAAGPMRYAWARLFYLYGPMEDERRLVPSLIIALLRGERVPVTAGEQIRDYLHVADVAAALHAIAASRVEGVVNVGSGKPMAIADLVSRVSEAVGRPELVALGARPYDPGDPMFVCADAGRLVATGWRPTHTLESGLADTIAWWRDRVAART